MDSISTVFSDFSTWLWDKVLYCIGYAVGFISSLIFKLYSLALDAWNFIVDKWSDLTDRLYNLINISDLFNQINNLDGSFGYFFDFFGGNQFLIASISGYLIRFAIRRIPGIG